MIKLSPIITIQSIITHNIHTFDRVYYEYGIDLTTVEAKEVAVVVVVYDITSPRPSSSKPKYPPKSVYCSYYLSQ